MLDLRDYQIEALDNLIDAERRGTRRALTVHPTGSGKTVTFSAMIQHLERPTLVLVHRDELIKQTTEKLSWIAPDLTVGVVKAERNELGCDVTVASVQTLARAKRREQIKKDAFGLTVADEAHHASAPTWMATLDYFGCLGPDSDVLTAGFTATPSREGSRLGVWDEVTAYRSIRQMILEGWLCPVFSQVVNTAADFSEVKTRSGDLLASMISEEMERTESVTQIAEAYAKYASDRKGIAFLSSVDLAFSLAAELRKVGITAEPVWGDMDYELRQLVLKRLRSGETQVVTNCGVLTEGFDEPSVSCIVVARPTKSKSLYIQMVGRGLRRMPGKKDCMILDIVGVSERQDLVALVHLGVDYMSDWRMSGKKEQLETEVHEAFEPNKAMIGGAKSTAILDPFGASRMRWLPVEDGWCLGAGKDVVILKPRSAELWQVVKYKGKGVFETINPSLPLDWAQGIGEDHAKAFSDLNKRDAYWTRQEPTVAQLNRLEQEGLPVASVKKVKTRGQAADLLTRIVARRAYRRLAA